MTNITQMSETQFAKFFGAILDKILEDPLEYFVKSSRFINFAPTPAQTVALKCIFGQELDNVEKHDIYEEVTLGTPEGKTEFGLKKVKMTETEIYEQMTGFQYDGDMVKARNRINLIVGRRGGKSTISAIIALYSSIKTNWKIYLSKTPVATVAILSHSVDFSQEILDILKGMVDGSEVLTRLRNKKRKDTQSTFHLKVPFIENGEIVYSEVAIKVGAASKKTTRGRATCTVLCDEIAFWNLAENAAESDVDILRAVRPALLQFKEHGTIIKLSSPGIKQGVLYEEWNKREQIKEDYVQFKAPSWVWNTILPEENFKGEWRLDPDGFDTEFRANFVDSISNFILPEYVDMCVLRGVNFLPPSTDNKTVYTAAIDAAFKSDKFAFSLVGYNEHRLQQHVLKYWQGSRNEPVKAFEVAQYIRNVCKQFGVQKVIADQHSFQPLREIFEKYGMTLVENTFSLPYKRKIYFTLKRLIHNQNIDLLDDALLKKEIKELQVEQTATGQIRIGHPVGGSDDTSDATAVATFNAMEKAGSGMIADGKIAGGSGALVKVDNTGKAFSAPSPEMLKDFHGFGGAVDNSSEWTRHPETGKMVRISELEEEDGLGGGSGGDFVF